MHLFDGSQGLTTVIFGVWLLLLLKSGVHTLCDVILLLLHVYAQLLLEHPGGPPNCSSILYAFLAVDRAYVRHARA